MGISILVGRTLSAVTSAPDEIVFTEAGSGKKWHLYHYQNCCENVYIEDICGDLQDLVGTPILKAEEVSNMPEPENRPICDDSYTWTFYQFATIKGYVTVRWFGTSNGYYSESVDFDEVL
jgi:hypothetical protein